MYISHVFVWIFSDIGDNLLHFLQTWKFFTKDLTTLVWRAKNLIVCLIIAIKTWYRIVIFALITRNERKVCYAIFIDTDIICNPILFIDTLDKAWNNNAHSSIAMPCFSSFLVSQVESISGRVYLILQVLKNGYFWFIFGVAPI